MSGTAQAPPLSNRAELDAAVLGFLDDRPADGDFGRQLGRMVALAEAQLARDVRAQVMIRRQEHEIRTRYVRLPGDFLDALDVRLVGPGGRALVQIEREAAGDLTRRRGGLAPRWFAIIGEELELLPDPTPEPPPASPATPQRLELAYYARPPALVAPTDSNPLLRQFPDLYLWGTLLQSAPYLRDDDRLQLWGGLYGAAVQGANGAARRAAWAGSRVNARIRAA